MKIWNVLKRFQIVCNIQFVLMLSTFISSLLHLSFVQENNINKIGIILYYVQLVLKLYTMNQLLIPIYILLAWTSNKALRSRHPNSRLVLKMFLGGVEPRGGFSGGQKGPWPSLLLNKMFDRECKNVQNNKKIAPNSLKMLEIVFQTIQNSTFSGGACPGKDHHRQLTGHPTLRPLLSKIPGFAPGTYKFPTQKWAWLPWLENICL